MSGNRTRSFGPRKQLIICGIFVLFGYIVLFCILQAPALWYNLRPDPMRSLFPDIFRAINPLFSGSWTSLTRDDNRALIMVPLYLAFLALVTGPLLFLLRRFGKRAPVTRHDRKAIVLTIFGFTLAFALVLLFVRGLLTSDIYSYTWYARIWVEHGASPFTQVPASFPPDPEGSIYWVYWLKEPSAYGPAWILISSLFFKIGEVIGQSFATEALSLRLLAIGAHLLNGWLVWSIVGEILARRRAGQARALGPRWRYSLPLQRLGKHGRRPYQVRSRARRVERVGQANRLQTLALLFYIWNPLLIVEFLASGHNDVLMLTFVLFGVWLYLKGLWRIAALSLGVASLIKLPALLLVPGYMWLLLWERIKQSRWESTLKRASAGIWRSTQALGIVLLAWVLLYWPFWEGIPTVQALFAGPANRLYLHSLGQVAWGNVPEPLANLLGVTEQREAFMQSVRDFLDANLRWWFFGLLALVAFLVTWRARTFQRMLIAWGWVMFAAVIAQSWFWPWYVSWIVVPAAIAPSLRLRNATLVFTVSALLLYLEEQILGRPFKFFLDWNGVVVMGPPLAYLVGSWLVAAWHRRRARNLQAARARERDWQGPGQPEPAT